MIAVFARGQLGATFLDWSIRYLRGDTQYLAWPDLQLTLLASNPIQQGNAHQHKKLHPEGATNTLKLIKHLDQQPRIGFEFRELGYDKVAHEADIDITCFDHEIIRQIKLAQQQDTSLALQHACDHGCKIIRIELHPAVRVWGCFDRGDGHEWLERRYPNSGISRQELWWKTFFSDTPASNEIWDLREHMALNIRPLDLPSLPPINNWQFDHFYMDCMQWWFMGERVVTELMSWLKISPDSERMESWPGIYRQWQQMLAPNINFALEVESIVEAIVQGQYRKLPHLTLFQESIIQHFLIYQHNLNLRNWQLSYFPDNTLELHRLLETNHHSVQLY